MQLLELRGQFTPEEARRGLAAICDAALGLQDHYWGKVQGYLRHYGELMLDELGQAFKFRSLSDAEVGHAFTLWLQNALCMPLSLIDENIIEFCKQHGLEPKQLIAAADDHDLNLGLVDDLVHRYLQKQRRATDEERSQEGVPIREMEVTHA